MKKLIALLSLTLLLALPLIVIAQPGLPGDPPQNPIGGLVVLAGLGGAYAVKKLRDGRREK